MECLAEDDSWTLSFRSVRKSLWNLFLVIGSNYHAVSFDTLFAV